MYSLVIQYCILGLWKIGSNDNTYDTENNIEGSAQNEYDTKKYCNFLI